MGRDNYMLIKSRKILSFITSIGMAVSLLSGTMAGSLQVQAAVSVSNASVSTEKTVVGNPYRTAINDDSIDNCKVTWNSVYFGNYPQSDASGKTKDPIRWQVLSVDENNVAVLLAEQNLDIYPYNNTIAEIGWEDCTLREWLNNDFLNKAFSKNEQKVLVDNCDDKVSLLTDSQALNAKYGFYPSTYKDSLRIKKNSAFAAAGGSSGYKEVSPAGEANGWWLKSGGYYEDDAECISDKGSVRADGITVAYEGNAVCPVVYVDLDKADELGLISNADDISQIEKIKQRRGYTFADYGKYSWRFNINGGVSVSSNIYVYSDPYSTMGVTIPEYIEDHGNKYEANEFESCSFVQSHDANGNVNEWKEPVYIYIPKTVNYISNIGFIGNESKVIICGQKGSYAEQFAKDHGIEFLTGSTIKEAKNIKIKNSINSKYVATVEKSKYTLDFSDCDYANQQSVVINISPMLEGTENYGTIFDYNYENNNGRYKWGYDIIDFNPQSLCCSTGYFENDMDANVTRLVLYVYPYYREWATTNLGSDILGVWVTDVQSDEKIAFAEIPIEITDKNNTLKKWNSTYTVTYDANGGYMHRYIDANGDFLSYDQYATYKIPNGEAVRYNHFSPTSLDEKEFLGWKTEGDNTLYKEVSYDLKYGEKFIGDYVPTSDVTFVAQWKDDSNPKGNTDDKDKKEEGQSVNPEDNSQKNQNNEQGQSTPQASGNNVQPSGNNTQTSVGNATPSGNNTSSQSNVTNTDSGTNSGTTPGSNTETTSESLNVGNVVDNNSVEYLITEKTDGQTKVAYQKPTDSNKTSYTIPDTITLSDGIVAQVTEIDSNAFKKCKKIKKVIIGKNVSKVRKNAFGGCKNLKTIIVKSTKLTKNSFGKNAFKGINKKATFKCPKKQFKNYKKWIKKAGAPKTAKYKK